MPRSSAPEDTIDPIVKAIREPPLQELPPGGKALVVVYLLVAVVYLAWRPTTLNPDAMFFSVLIYAAELFGFAVSLLHLFMVWRLTVRVAPPAPAAARVDVLVTSFNEPVEVVRRTLLSVRGLDYPHETWLLDDGDRPEMETLARELGVGYRTREGNAHAKAGNLNHALEHSTAEFIAIFDADHAPRRDFLDQTLGYFRDPQVAFVQAPQDFYNLDSFQHRQQEGSRRVWSEQALFFRVIQRGKDRWNAAFFCGSCAVMRRSALDEVGGFRTGSITEDLDTSVALHRAGYRSVYVAQSLAFGLAPASAEPFLSQRVRWGQGAMQVLRQQGLFLRGRLSTPQRLNYLASVLTYFDGWQKAVFYLAPVWVLLTGTMPLVTDISTFLILFLPYFALTFIVFEEVGRGYGRSVLIEQYNMARFAAFMWATLGLVRRTLRFRVTDKQRPDEPVPEPLLISPQILVAVLNAAALVGGWLFWRSSQHLPWYGLIANLIWAGVNLLLAVLLIRFAMARNHHYRRRDYRFPVPLPATLQLEDGPHAVTVDDISPSGCRIYGQTPRQYQVGEAVGGVLHLPGETVRFQARVASEVPGDAAGGHYTRAQGLEFQWEDLHARERLELFLYGSDLQWTINRLREKIALPWHPADRRRNPDPDPSSHWSALELPDGEPGLIDAGPSRTGHRIVASFRRLDQEGEMDVLQHTRTGASGHRFRMLRMLATIDTPTGAMYLTEAQPC